MANSDVPPPKRKKQSSQLTQNQSIKSPLPDRANGAGPGPSSEASDAAARRAKLQEERHRLPVWGAKKGFLELVQKHRVLVLVGETGSGKTTQIPQFLHSAGWSRGGMVACTQPRRVAAMTVARRVSEEMGCQLGQQVGYTIRFDDTTSPATRIKYMTDGMLLREALIDPLLSRYKVVIIDEAHERTVDTDVLLGLLKGVVARRSQKKKSGEQQQQQEQQAEGGAAAPGHKKKQKKGQQEGQDDGTTDATAGDATDDDSFRLIVMSATLDAKKFVDYFSPFGAVAALVSGRTFPVQVYYTAQPEENYLDAAINATVQIHQDEGPGDILVFLTGQDEIDSTERLLADRAKALASAAAVAAARAASAQAALAAADGDADAADGEEDGAGAAAAAASGGKRGGAGLQLLVLPIYAALPPEQQMKVFEPAPPGFRKAILATNIAETSITIPGVRYVIDTGFVKSRGYNAKLGADSLQVLPVSQAQARQRSGRAGREAAGKAYRLYTESTFSTLDANTPPEILRSNLGSVVLELKALGVEDVVGFDFLDKPPQAAIIRSLELLFALGALDSRGALTNDVGRPMSRLPVDPMYGKVLLASGPLGCAIEAMQIVSMVSTDGIWVTPRAKRDEAAAARLKFVAREGDHLTLLNVMRAFGEVPAKQQAGWCRDNFVNLRAIRKASDIYSQLERHLAQLQVPIKSCGEDTEAIRKALVAGLFTHAACKQPDGNAYKVIATGQLVFMHPGSTLAGGANSSGGVVRGGGARKPECIVFNELVKTTKQYAREVSAIEPRWLPELAPAFFAAKASAAAAGAAVF